MLLPICFGGTSAEERAAGLPGHGEAQMQAFEIRESGKDRSTGAITLHARLPLVQENFTRTFRMVDGENIVYVESALASEVAFDRPISWAEHTTLGSPFLQSGVTLSSISGSRAQNRLQSRRGTRCKTDPGHTKKLCSMEGSAPAGRCPWRRCLHARRFTWDGLRRR